MDSQPLICHTGKRSVGKVPVRLARLAITAFFVGLFSTPCLAMDDGFFQVQLSVASQNVPVVAVDPNTLQTLPTTFTADSGGSYQVDALLVANGDTANPIGGFALTGDLGGSLRVAVQFDSVLLGGAVTPADAFLSIISGIDVAPFAAGGPEQVRTTQQSSATGTPGLPAAQLLTSSLAFMSTADDKDAAVPGVSGFTPVPGAVELTTGFGITPPLPPDTVESEFSQIVMQQDIGFFGLVDDSDFAGVVDTTTELSRDPFSNLAGDYNNDGVVEAADYTVWRDNFGRPAGTLVNDFTGQPVGQAQYDQWVDHFSDMVGNAHSYTVPEPTAQVLLAAAVATLSRWRATS